MMRAWKKQKEKERQEQQKKANTSKVKDQKKTAKEKAGE